MRNRRRRKINQDPPKGIGSHLPSLSLFIMMLAFFMILNTMSSYEEKKVTNIMQSLDDTFASKITQSGNDKPTITQSSEKSLGEGDTIERIEALFKSQIPGFEEVKNKTRGMMQVQVPRKDFEDAVNGLGGDKASTGFARNFLPMLVSLMRSDTRGAPYRIDITYHLDENPARMQNQQPQRMVETIRQVGAIAQEIERAGLQAKLMTIGLEKGDTEVVELLFQRHVPFSLKSSEVLENKDPENKDPENKDLGNQGQGVSDEQKITQP